VLLTGSVFGTASWATQASTASYVVTAQTASYVATAQTASSVSPLIQTVIISGSLFITGSPVRLVGLPTTEPLITGSLWLSGSGEGAATGSKYLMVFNG